MRLKCAGLTDTGMVRDHNEDNFYISSSESFVVVADGMGGHLSGEVASGMAVETISEYYRETENQTDPIELEFWPYGKKKPKSREERRLIAAITKANANIHKASTEVAEYKGMGTTTVGVYVVKEGVFIAHVGDSRCYRFRKGEIKQMTEDHSLANEYIRSNILKPEDLPSFPYKNVITRAVGLAPTVEVETHFYEHEDGDIYILCSDGLSDPVKEPQMRDILDKYQDDRKEACRQLIIAANTNRGPDNVTALLAKVVY